MSTALDRWRAGADPSSFTPAEAGALARHLMERGHSVYTDKKHPDHAALSAEVSALHQRAYQGNVGPGGEVVA